MTAAWTGHNTSGEPGPEQPASLSVGRLLRVFRMASRLSLDEAAIAVSVASQRLRELEAGLTEIKFLEGGQLAKGYGFCQPWFRRHVESAAGRDTALNVLPPPLPPMWRVPDEPGVPGPTTWIDQTTG